MQQHDGPGNVPDVRRDGVRVPLDDSRDGRAYTLGRCRGCSLVRLLHEVLEMRTTGLDVVEAKDALVASVRGTRMRGVPGSSGGAAASCR
jgi:hypothetical protein